MASPKQQTYILGLIEDLKAEEASIPNAVLTKIEQVVAAIHPDLVAVIADADAISSRRASAIIEQLLVAKGLIPQATLTDAQAAALEWAQAPEQQRDGFLQSLVAFWERKRELTEKQWACLLRAHATNGAVKSVPLDMATLLNGIPDGWYAIESRTGTNDLDFFLVTTNAGRRNPANKGKRWVKRYVGGGVPGAEKTIDMRTSERIAVAKELALLSPEECQASQLLFGQEVGSCGRCGRSLSDEVSRNLGYGPECRKSLSPDVLAKAVADAERVLATV